VLPLLLACSLGTFERTECQASHECLEAFGLGSVCSEGGYCADAQAIPRCETTVPEDLYSTWDDHRDDLLLGALFDAGTDQSNIAAVDMAVADVTLQGGLDGREFVVVHCDYSDDEEGLTDGRTGEEAVQSAASFLFGELGAPVAIGPAGSNDSIFAFEVAKNIPTALISPSATSAELTYIDGLEKSDETPGLFWRTVGSDEIQAGVMAALIRDNGETSVSLVFQKGSYGQNFINALRDSLSGYGIDDVQSFDFIGLEEVGNKVDEAASGMAGMTAAVFISSDIDDVVEFVEEASTHIGYQDVHIYLADSASDGRFLEGTGSKDADIYGTRPATPSGAVFDTFADSYEAASGYSAEDDVYAAYTHDAAWIAMYGYAWAHHQEQGTSGTEIARGLRRLSEPGGEEIEVTMANWAEVVARLSSGSAINAVGASGDLDFDPETEEVVNPIEIWRVGTGTDGRCFYTLKTCSQDDECEDSEPDPTCTPETD
jgi:ABC-type branched-subunit amino acid transport system substrate-binding protein